MIKFIIIGGLNYGKRKKKVQVLNPHTTTFILYLLDL